MSHYFFCFNYYFIWVLSLFFLVSLAKSILICLSFLKTNSLIHWQFLFFKNLYFLFDIYYFFLLLSLGFFFLLILSGDRLFYLRFFFILRRPMWLWTSLELLLPHPVYFGKLYSHFHLPWGIFKFLLISLMTHWLF